VSGVNTAQIMAEYGLGIDDVRWYLALQQADRLLQYRQRRLELARLIWSGRLEADLYEMPERFLQEMQARLERGTRDEAQVRTIFRQVADSRDQRPRPGRGHSDSEASP
jgi:hypothetical protein